MDIIYSPLYKVNGRTPLTDFSFSITENPTSVSPSTNNTTLLDGNIETVTSAGITNNYNILVNKYYPFDEISFQSVNPAVSTVNTQGQVTRVSNGTSEIKIISKYGMKLVSRPISTSAGSYTNFLSYQVGSLARHIEDAIFNMINGKTYNETTSKFFETGNYPATNPNLFTQPLDLSALSRGGPNMLLISPRHVIGSHTSNFGDFVNTPILFKALDGTSHQRTVTSMLPFSTNNTESDDQWVGVLDTPIPSNGAGAIQPLKLLGADFTSKIKLATDSSNNSQYKLQMLRKKQAGAYQKMEIIEGTLWASPSSISANLRKSTRAPYSSWSSIIESGDSNGAVLLPIDETGGANYKPVLVTSINTTGGGRLFAHHITEIQTLMNTLASGYTLQTINLSSFSTVV